MQTTEIGMVINDSPAAKAGIQAGDKILSVNNKKVEHWEAIQTAIYFDFIGEDIVINAERSDVQQVFIISRNNIPEITESSFGIIPTHTEAVINDVISGKPAEKAGLKPDDVIVSLNSQKVFNQDHVIKIIRANPSKPISIQVMRNEEIKNLTVTPSEEGLIGITVGSRYTGPVLNVHYGLFESFPKGVNQTINATVLFGHSIWQLIVGKAEFSKSVGGPVKIAQMATRSAEIGVLSFLAFMALLSISLAVMNILPFPALDGGHLIVLIYEAIVRKPLPHIVQIRIQQVGMVILLSFMMFVLYNDIFG
jgi:regulator of sigma E protease